MVKNNKTGFFSIKLRDEKMELDIIGLVSACSYALDCIEAELVHVTNRHGKRVAYISVCMAEKFGIIGEALQDLAMCALLHDNALTQYISEEVRHDLIKDQTMDISSKKLGVHCVYGEQNIKKLGNASVQNILAGGKFLYYYQTGASGDAGIGALRTVRSFNRCKLNGSDVTGLTRDPISTAQLVGSNLYIMTVDDNGPLFYRMKIDKSDKTELANFEINPASAVNGTIYYNGTQDNHYLYAMNTATDGVSTVWDGNLWYPIVQGDYVYYMDVENDYRLCRYSLSRNEIEVLTNERIDCFNVGYGYVYYQVNGEEACLKCMRDDGSDSWVIAEGNYTAINMTSQYVYFQMFGDDSSWYHSPLGSQSYSGFDAARQAALDAMKK